MPYCLMVMLKFSIELKTVNIKINLVGTMMV
jgi:hypothetical protein